ncbi:GD15470 [Drosophila simulans]|uniref:GD15470 n=1 Tax=Drosophila simulans TaxID=7240 RepID=B4NUW2_DROSI|nr:GD15470 [Drosophila simulans]
MAPPLLPIAQDKVVVTPQKLREVADLKAMIQKAVDENTSVVSTAPSKPDFPHSATSPSRQQSPASAAAEGCPHTAYSHRRAGHGLEDLRNRAMIDPCMPVSSIDRSLAAAFRLPITRLGGNEVCSVTLRSRTSTFRLNVVLKIEPSLRIRTPIRALSDCLSKN